MTLTIIPRPEGQRADYLFFQDAAGQRYKALHELRTNAAAQPVLAISIAPIDDEGHALLLADDVPDVSYHTHTFTEAELAAADFNMDGRVAEILRSLAERKAAEVAARATVAAIGDVWRACAINLN